MEKEKGWLFGFFYSKLFKCFVKRKASLFCHWWNDGPVCTYSRGSHRCLLRSSLTKIVFVVFLLLVSSALGSSPGRSRLDRGERGCHSLIHLLLRLRVGFMGYVGLSGTTHAYTESINISIITNVELTRFHFTFACSYVFLSVCLLGSVPCLTFQISFCYFFPFALFYIFVLCFIGTILSFV